LEFLKINLTNNIKNKFENQLIKQLLTEMKNDLNPASKIASIIDGRLEEFVLYQFKKRHRRFYV
jgi:hypothetical protein